MDDAVQDDYASPYGLGEEFFYSGIYDRAACQVAQTAKKPETASAIIVPPPIPILAAGKLDAYGPAPGEV